MCVPNQKLWHASVDRLSPLLFGSEVVSLTWLHGSTRRHPLSSVQDNPRRREVQRLLDEKFQRPVAEKTKAYVAPKKQQCVVFLKVSMLIPPFIQWHRILDIFPILISTLGALAQNLRAEARYYFTLVRSLTIRWSKHRCSIRADDALLSMPALAILAIDIHYDEVQLNQGGTLTRKRNGSIERTTRDERAEAVGLDRMRGDNGDWQDIDVEQPNAVGPWLRAQVTKSKPGWDQ